MPTPYKPQTLERLLQSQGFGSRKACRLLVESGRVTINGERYLQANTLFTPPTLTFNVNGEDWPWRQYLYLALYKPAGFECSRTPQHHNSVFGLLPPHFVERGIQPVGRLDADTTGLLLLTDDGDFNHAMASPKRHVPKTYQIQARHTVSDEQIVALLAGVQLHDEPAPLAALAAEKQSDTVLELTIDQGKYHQVKRMLAAAGNRVDGLHRLAIGTLRLGEGCLAGLAEGHWCELDATALHQLGYTAV
ncbi:16S rRNA pseudouridine(516) synthase [Chitinimonas sp. BJB300]|nr:16S rRNA pseudouridine(516) synthase [Chitinimonas sp. BJB300]TSJ90964.1 16S rRNA pseudouridine(516) synthase [Chitinimonas sp. BJB300]